MSVGFHEFANSSTRSLRLRRQRTTNHSSGRKPNRHRFHWAPMAVPRRSWNRRRRRLPKPLRLRRSSQQPLLLRQPRPSLLLRQLSLNQHLLPLRLRRPQRPHLQPPQPHRLQIRRRPLGPQALLRMTNQAQLPPYHPYVDRAPSAQVRQAAPHSYPRNCDSPGSSMNKGPWDL